MPIDMLRNCAFYRDDVIVEKFHLPLQPDIIHQKDDYQRFAFAKVVQKHVLQSMQWSFLYTASVGGARLLKRIVWQRENASLLRIDFTESDTSTVLWIRYRPA